MGRILFRRSRKFKRATACVTFYGKLSLGESTRLIKRSHSTKRKFVKTGRTLYEYARFRAPAYAAEVGKRNRNDERAGAGNYQKAQCLVYPLRVNSPQKGRIDGAYHRGNDAGDY